MKKALALLMAVVMIVSVCCVSVSADQLVGKKVRVLMSTEPVKLSMPASSKKITSEDVASAIANGKDLIPEDCKVSADRITVLEQRRMTCSLEEYDVSFKVWSTIDRSIMVFFRADGSDEWELMSCNLGDVIEARFLGNGIFAIAVAW